MYFTANCVMHGIVDSALLSASRATDKPRPRVVRQRRGTPANRDHQRSPAPASDLDAITAAARRNPHLNRGVPEDLITELRA